MNLILAHAVFAEKAEGHGAVKDRLRNPGTPRESVGNRP